MKTPTVSSKPSANSSLTSSSSRLLRYVTLAAATLLSAQAAFAQYTPADKGSQFRAAVTSDRGVVSCISDEAAQVGTRS